MDTRVFPHPGDQLAPSEPLLVGLTGHVRGSRYLLDQRLHGVGRHPDNDVWLDDVTIAAHHARLERAGHGWTVTDLGGVGGTWVAGSLVVAGASVAVRAGDVVRFGAFAFRLLEVTPGG